MRRPLTFAVAVLALAACAKKETPAADTAAPAVATPAPLTSADLTGVWDATGTPMDKDTIVVRFTMTNTGDSSTVVFASGETTRGPAGTIAGDSVVSTAGPFKSQVRKGQQATTRMVLRKQGDMLVGVTHAKYSNGDSASFRITATKRP